ncbi:MAG: preprotein translocase subunit SecY [Myxococcota bacterium]
MSNIFSEIWEMEDLRKRVLFTLGMLGVYRMGIFVPAPGVDRQALADFVSNQENTLFGLYNMFSGGALAQFSVFFLGIMPYITASIIMQLFAEMLPALKRIKEEGQQGQNRITQYTRYLTILISIAQSSAMAVGMEQMQFNGSMVVITPGWAFRAMTVLTMTAGACFVMWLGEQMTERGIGNGASIIITCGIIAGLPAGATQLYQLVNIGDMVLLEAVMLLGFMFIVIFGIVFIERGQRRVPLQYAKRVMGSTVYEGQTTYLPLKVNTAGVIPPIFASSLLMFPGTISQFLPDNAAVNALQDALSFGSWLYNAVYAVLIVFFAFFYTAITFNPEDVADNLKKQGGFIPRVRPGRETARYIEWLLTRLTAGGSVYLAAVCVLPTLLIVNFNLPFYFGGTGLLIIVGVSLDTVGQIQAQLSTRHYDAVPGPSGGRVKGRRRQLGGQGPFV